MGRKNQEEEIFPSQNRPHIPFAELKLQTGGRLQNAFFDEKNAFPFDTSLWDEYIHPHPYSSTGGSIDAGI
jgi:hypothetical protein